MGHKIVKIDPTNNIYLTPYTFSKYADDPDKYREIWKDWLDFTLDELSAGRMIRIPLFGRLQVRLKKTKPMVMPNYPASMDLWEKDPEAFKERRLIYFDNFHTDGYKAFLSFRGRGIMFYFNAAMLTRLKERVTKAMREDYGRFVIRKKRRRNVSN